MSKASRRVFGLVLPSLAVMTLAACDGGFELPFGGESTRATGTAATALADAVPGTERDVEAPEVFQVADDGLWDGRPSLGGVWVAHPDVTDPERVIIVNEATGQSVIGALFRKERETPGPRIQVSSDAAVELGLLAGQPAKLTVTALRKEIVAEPEVPVALPAAPEVEAQPLETDTITAAAAAIDAAEAPRPVITPASVAPAAAPVAKPTSSLAKPYIQIGIFSIEGNANNTGASLRNAGILPTVLRQNSQGKTFWRVIVGPTNSETERAQVLSQVKALGFEDAYFVTN